MMEKPSYKNQHKRHNEDAQYNAEQRTIQVLQVLKQISDDAHPVTQRQILEAMKDTGDPMTTNPGTLSNTIDEILLQINPLCYDETNDEKYRITFNGEAYKNRNLKNHLVLQKQEFREKKKNREVICGKSPSILKLKYVHDFSDDELNQLLDVVNSSSKLSIPEKEHLMKKLVNTASQYFNSPYYDRNKEKVSFSEYGSYNRKTARNPYENSSYQSANGLANNIEIINKAIQNKVKIAFSFCDVKSDGSLEPRNHNYVLSPYYIVIYHENYYLLGVMESNQSKEKVVSHYRVDLMRDIVTLEKSVIHPYTKKELRYYSKVEPMQNVRGLPTRREWNPEKYMREHMYMFFGEPRDIKLKVKSGNYTWIRDWFGNYYKSRPSEETGYDIVIVRCVPDAMVHFAMQYGVRVEVLDAEVRKKIRKEIETVGKMYDES